MAQATTHHDEQMLQAHPCGAMLDRIALLSCLQACLDCAEACGSCAAACSAESDPKLLVRCIRLNNDCADLCTATSRILGRQAEPERTVIHAAVEACATACGARAAECERHGNHMEHCRICAEACRTCEAACRALVTAKASA
jgi:hypothetical protein